MSWIEKLYETYENNTASIGDANDRTPLLPVSHTIQNAHIEIAIDNMGNFLRAGVVQKTDAPTIVPCTESSAGRAGSKPVNHPLCDKLQYVAGDFLEFGGEVTSGFAENPMEPHETYVNDLSEWCASPYKHTKVSAVLAYVKKGQVIADLVKAQILQVDNHGKLIKTRLGRTEDASEIFRVIPPSSSPEDGFVRWMVEVPGDPQHKLWKDDSVWRSWADYTAAIKSVEGLCFVTGEQKFLADQHPKRIRHGGDGAKLISSNDTSGYTFRGRFTTADEACGIGFEVTQKAHSALRWLISRQGWRDGEQAIVAWAVSGAKIPDPFADTLSLLSGAGDNSTEIQVGYTAQEIGTQLAKRIAGYSVKLGSTDDVVIMGLDSATPGRMAITFYRELTGSEFLERIRAWHDVANGCTWRQRLGKERVFIGASAPRDIAEAAHGKRLDDKLRKATIERLLPCIIDGAPIPRDLVESCVRRASNRNGLETWEWEKALGIACALYRYQNNERRYTMALERDRKTRDYLYGRLLALSEHLEGRALSVAGEKRETNAGKLMQRFAERPYSTWLTIETSLTPYKVRLRTKRAGFLHDVEKEIDEVACSFNTEDFLSDRRLTGEFLLGYHCQRAALWPKAEQDATDAVDVED